MIALTSRDKLLQDAKDAARLLLNATEAADQLGIAPRTLWGMTKPRGPIPTVRVGRRVLYSRASLVAWIAKQEGGAE